MIVESKNYKLKDYIELINIIDELTEDPDLYINLKAITERFIKIDNSFNHSPWNLLQILSQLQMIVPKRIGNNTVKELLDEDKPGCDLSKFYRERENSQSLKGQN